MRKTFWRRIARNWQPFVASMLHVLHVYCIIPIILKLGRVQRCVSIHTAKAICPSEVLSLFASFDSVSDNRVVIPAARPVLGYGNSICADDVHITSHQNSLGASLIYATRSSLMLNAWMAWNMVFSWYNGHRSAWDDWFTSTVADLFFCSLRILRLRLSSWLYTKHSLRMPVVVQTLWFSASHFTILRSIFEYFVYSRWSAVHDELTVSALVFEKKT